MAIPAGLDLRSEDYYAIEKQRLSELREMQERSLYTNAYTNL